ncbi:Protein of unknown function [Cotesia congregata]|uniref:Uncharacterized protein n=1 Tax=Cotesia congregata TaxID=51543 RepID=A0A8J2HKB8_COTCN|nr:Protein of unknown function [Cotesia congregata]
MLRNNNLFSEVESFCYTTDDCSDPMMICVDHRCQCLKGCVRLNNKCYRVRGGSCTESSNCMSTHLECRNKTCTSVNEFKEGNWTCHNKSGATVCWGNEMSKGSPNILCHAIHNYFSVAGFLKPNEKIVWKNSNIKFDNTVYGGPDADSWYHLYLICQTEHNHTKYIDHWTIA